MPGGENQGVDAPDRIGWNIALLQNFSCPHSALQFIVGSPRVVDHVVAPDGHFHFSGMRSEVASPIELLQAILNVSKRMVGAIRLGIVLDKIFKDRFGG